VFIILSLPLHEYIDAVSKATTVKEVHDACSGVCGYFEFDFFLYAAMMPTSFVNPNIINISGYPDEWREVYKNEEYMKVDPSVAYCTRNIVPVAWDKLAPHKQESKAAWDMLGEARGYGLRSGVSFPLHSPTGEAAMLSFVVDEEHKDAKAKIEHAMPHVHLFNAYMHEAVRKIFNADSVSIAKLTEREKQCLLWMAEGKTAWETGRILNISERTVTFHMQNTVEKLQVVNRQQAVARAVSLGLISLQV